MFVLFQRSKRLLQTADTQKSIERGRQPDSGLLQRRKPALFKALRQGTGRFCHFPPGKRYIRPPKASTGRRGGYSTAAPLPHQQPNARRAIPETDTQQIPKGTSKVHLTTGFTEASTSPAFQEGSNHRMRYQKHPRHTAVVHGCFD